MTQAEVAQQLGSPLRTQRLSGGRETWFYESIHKTRTRHTADNSSRPGESVYERDLRIDTEGMVKSVEYVTTEIRETTPVTFDRDGRLLAPPARRFVPTGS
jgi:outer membrane protein assembly factor BamE (lipoprotein component of BamABCDE complex)